MVNINIENENEQKASFNFNLQPGYEGKYINKFFEKAKKLLIDHYISVGSDYSNELNVPIEELIGDQPPGLELLAKTSLSETERDIKQKLLSHHQYWKRISENSSKSDKISKLNKKI